MKKLSIALTVAVACLTFGVATASADKKRFESNVTLSHSSDPYSDTFFGVVTSSRNGCIGDRVVRLKRVEAGSDPVIASDLTDASGNYQITVSGLANGTYYVKVKRKFLARNSNHKHICKGTRSQNEVVVS